MQKLHCDGCGFSEETDQPKHKIAPVRLMVIDDPRVPEGRVTHEADLCPTCQGNVLHTYFGIAAEGKLEVPGFLGPTEREREFRVAN